MRSIVVAVSGPSASGKSTTVAQLALEFGWRPVEEAYYRLSPRPRLIWGTPSGLERLERRLLEEEARRFREVRSLARRGPPIVLDTDCLDPVEYTAGLVGAGLAQPGTFREIVGRARALARGRRLGVADLTVVLSVPPATRRARASADPARHPAALRRRHEEVAQVVRRTVVPVCRGVLGPRLRVVGAEGSPKAVAGIVHRAAASVRALSDPCGTATQLLEALLERVSPGP